MSNLEAVVATNNNFTVELARKMVGDENVVMSPLSMLTALALVCLGAKGNPKTRIKEVLQFESCTDIHSGLEQLLSTLTESEEYELKINNMLFVDKTCNISETFSNVSKIWNEAKPEIVDFKNHPKDAWEYMVNWLKEKTEGTFQNISEDSINNDTKLVVVNTAHLLANWTQNFPHFKTKMELFTLSTNEKQYMQLMCVIGYFNVRVIKDQMLSIIELPYGKKKTLSMYVILPDRYDGIIKIKENISYEQLNDWTNPNSMKRTFIEVYLPLFKIESNYSMKNILHRMGMADVFSNTKSNMSEIFQDNLYASDIINLVTMEAAEDGTEQITDVDDYFGFLTIRLSQITFKVDHPFIFIVRDILNKCFVFYGEFQKP
ncbi:ovalbumin-related protein Y-like [Hyla sarda]|uniref:ovalbumin-related protein Y-like n=1 Tax=Hyla sarda TaxID=327740 RepID=UPI0024C302EC|nr:ovalbumin-related protein Y-like [Hyla sarda]